MRLLSCVCGCALVAAIVRGEDPKPAPAQWSNIKGTVVFPKNKPIPKQLPLPINNAPGCQGKNPILDESVIVDPKTRGIKNVVVYLRPADPKDKAFAKNEIHPNDAKRKPATIEITQPCCMFVNRITVARPGDTIVVKNPAAIVHNFFWDSSNNGAFNVNIPAMNQWTMPNPLIAEISPIQYKCTVHPWMTGYVRIFDHPYFAVTDAEGRFEIANAPVGKYRIVYWHESGLRGGREGRFGEPITITGPTLEMKPVDFEVK